MKIGIIILVSLAMGYWMGQKFPLIDFLAPEQLVEFESDFVIKAGHKATSRYYGTSMEPVELPLEIAITHDETPKLKLLGPKKSK